MSYQETFTEPVLTSANQRPNTPQIKIQNPQKKNLFLNKIECTFDVGFSLKGVIEVRINGNPIFDNSKNPSFFSKYSMFSIPLQEKEFLRSAYIEIFAWNGIDSNTISVDFVILISEDDTPVYSSSVPLPYSEKITEVKDEKRVTTADGGSGIVRTIYTCPLFKKARIKKLTTFVDNTGSAGSIRLKINNVRIAEWYASGSPTASSPTGGVNRPVYSGAEKVYNIPYDDLEGAILTAGQSIIYDGTFSGNFNATVDYAYSILESDA